MKTLKKPLNDINLNLQSRKTYYYGKCTNPKCKGEYAFEDAEAYISNTYYFKVCATCPNCYKEIRVYINKKKAGIT